MEDAMEKLVLLVDFGSTYSKFTAVDRIKEKIVATTVVPTSQKEGLATCYEQGKKQIFQQLSIPVSSFSEEFFASSAWGGFRMVTIGTTRNLTTEAAKRAALGAGTRILKTYSFRITQNDVLEIIQLEPDVILLTGGTDGGDQEIICHNARLLNQQVKNAMIIVAGNKSALPKIRKIMTEPSSTIFCTENVMPKINELHVEAVRKIAREAFMKKIIQSKGIQEVSKHSHFPIIPTPTAVLQATQLLAQGTAVQKGWGNLISLDIGGATTDVHSIGKGLPESDQVFFKGLPEPYVKRTVEGDLGLRSSAQGILENTGIDYFKHLLADSWTPEKIKNSCHQRIIQTDYVPTLAREKDFDEKLAMLATNLALQRHAGILQERHTSNRLIYLQYGKDLRNFKKMILMGGIIAHHSDPRKILSLSKKENDYHLTPVKPRILVDKKYIFSAMGLLSQKYPDLAFHLLTENLF